MSEHRMVMVHGIPICACCHGCGIEQKKEGA